MLSYFVRETTLKLRVSLGSRAPRLPRQIITFSYIYRFRLLAPDGKNNFAYRGRADWLDIFLFDTVTMPNFG